MENRQPRLERAEEAVQAIIAAATSELLEEGLESITHRKVAAMANASLRSTTYYFKSVKALRREALKVSFGINARQREGVLATLSSKTKADVIDLITHLAYGTNLDPNHLAIVQKNVLIAALDEDYADLMQQIQRDVEVDVQKVLDHFGIEHEASKVIALLDGRIYEYLLSGAKTNFKAKLAADLGL